MSTNINFQTGKTGFSYAWNYLKCDGMRPNKDVSYFAYAEEKVSKLCCLLCWNKKCRTSDFYIVLIQYWLSCKLNTSVNVLKHCFLPCANVYISFLITGRFLLWRNYIYIYIYQVCINSIWKNPSPKIYPMCRKIFSTCRCEMWHRKVCSLLQRTAVQSTRIHSRYNRFSDPVSQQKNYSNHSWSTICSSAICLCAQNVPKNIYFNQK